MANNSAIVHPLPALVDIKSTAMRLPLLTAQPSPGKSAKGDTVYAG
jgi:hypothetical protein